MLGHREADYPGHAVRTGVAAQWTVEWSAAAQGIAQPFVEAGRAGRRPGVAAECTPQTIERQTDRLAVTEAAVQQGEQQAGVKGPGECVAASCWSMHILCSVTAAVEVGRCASLAMRPSSGGCDSLPHLGGAPCGLRQRRLCCGSLSQVGLEGLARIGR